MLSSLAQMVGVPFTILCHASKTCEQRTTKPLHHQPLTAILVLRNLAERSMLPPALVVTWATNISPSAKAKVMTHRRARMLATLRQLMTAATQQLTAAICHAYVFNASFSNTYSTDFVILILRRYSSTPTFSPRTQSHKVSTAPCTIRPGAPRTAQTMVNTVDLTVIPCQNLTATPRTRK